jgi:hypothetical protein
MTANYSTDKNPTSPPPIEQVSEYRNTTRTGSQPPPPAGAQFGKGMRTIQEIEEATSARRKQSASWSNRDTGPRSGGK